MTLYWFKYEPGMTVYAWVGTNKKMVEKKRNQCIKTGVPCSRIHKVIGTSKGTVTTIRSRW